MLQKVKYVGSGNLDDINNSSQCFESQTFEFLKFLQIFKSSKKCLKYRITLR